LKTQCLSRPTSPVYRWERDESTPRKRTDAPLVNVITAANAQAGQQLAVALGLVKAEPADATSTADKIATLDRAVFRMADELDSPPRRVRAAVLGFLKRVADARVPLDLTRRQLETWVAEDQSHDP
jgi:hypothetical protein